jgi:hypothetical protein
MQCWKRPPLGPAWEVLQYIIRQARGELDIWTLVRAIAQPSRRAIRL